MIIFSAGIGRTGVFITLYYLFESIKHDRISNVKHARMLNVKQLVDTIRLYRAHLVQTVVCIINNFNQYISTFQEQYEYIYRCLAETAIHPCDGRPIQKFIEYYNQLLPTARSINSEVYYDFNVKFTFFIIKKI